jgi:hypothetical protein
MGVGRFLAWKIGADGHFHFSDGAVMIFAIFIAAPHCTLTTKEKISFLDNVHLYTLRSLCSQGRRETGRLREPMYSVKHGLHNPREAGHGRSATNNTHGAENDIIGVTRFVCMRLEEKTVVRTSWQIGYYNIMSMLLQAKTSPAAGQT